MFEDGSFYRWSSDRPLTDGRELVLVRSDTAAANALFRGADRVGLGRTRYSEPGNGTCWLSIRIVGVTNEVAWPVSTRPKKIARIVDLAGRIDAGLNR